jgi:pimeloyl-ACP methyl ester carboxylesterase
LGAQYIHLFPHRVRVAVLDGAVDPLNDYPQMLTHQLQGFDEAFSQFAAWCSGDDRCRPLGDARAAATQILAAAQRAPIPSSADARHATASLVSTGIAQALYSRSLWGQLGQALVEARAGDAKGLLQLADEYYQRFNGHYANINDVYNVVECNDSKPGPPDAVARATLRGWYARYPLFAVPFVSQLLVCQQWQADRTVPPLPSAPDAAHTVLVIGNLHDPATPYQGAKDLTRTLGNARLLTWDGEGHTSYLEGSSCIDDYVDRYLVQGALPPPRTTCR